MVSIRCVGVGVGERQSEDTFDCFGAKPTQMNLRARFPTRPEEDELRQGPRAGQIRVSDSQEKVTVRVRRLLKEELGPVDSEARSANARGWVSVPGSCWGILFGNTLVTDTEAQNTRKVPKLLLSYA